MLLGSYYSRREHIRRYNIKSALKIVVETMSLRDEIDTESTRLSLKKSIERTSHYQRQSDLESISN